MKRDGKAGLVVASAGNRFVIASSRAALDAALSPNGRLGDAAAFRDAAAKLGSGVRPSFFVDAQRLGDLAAAKHGGHAKGPALDAFGALVGGGRQDGGRRARRGDPHAEVGAGLMPAPP